jgi:predicted HicB family RNase H-like nuclease
MLPKKPGRPRIHDDRVTTAVRLPEPLYRRLKETAEDRDSSLNHLLVKAATYYLDKLPPLEPSEELAS